MPDAPTPAAHAPIYRPTEIIPTDSPVVACDGGDGALGHPRVWLHIKGQDILCPYCSRLFVLNPGADHASGH